MKKQLYRAAAATVLGLSLTTGIAAAQTGTINQTGADSSNRVVSHVRNHRYVSNDNDVSLQSSNHQSGYTGDATTTRNTTAGDAKTGSVTNSHSMSAALTVDNSSSASAGSMASSPASTSNGSISNTGYNSDNTVKSVVSNSTVVRNDNDVHVSSYNTQTGSTGDAKVSENTTGGSATTGNVSNTSSDTFVLNIKN